MAPPVARSAGEINAQPKRMRFFILVFFTLLLLVTCRYQERYQSDRLRITFLDVGQGDCALVQFPGGKVWLIDAGGGFRDWDLGRRELLLEMARLGILHVDTAILSHPDEDHAMGYRGLFEQLSVGEWRYHARLDLRTFSRPVMRELRWLANTHKIRVAPMALEERGLEKGVNWRLLPLRAISNLTNDQALIVHLRYGGCDLLFTGDIESAGEAALAKDFTEPIEFLKVAHHGSKTSTPAYLLKSWQPWVSVISVGKENNYGHPHPSVIFRLNQVRSRMLRTDFHGYVRLAISPDGSFSCESFKGNCGKGRCEKAQPSG